MLEHAEKAGEPHALATVTEVCGALNSRAALVEALKAAHLVLQALVNPNPVEKASAIYFRAVEAEVKVRRALLALTSGAAKP